MPSTPPDDGASSAALPPRFCLRSDLTLHPPGVDGGRGVLEDTANNKFYRLGPRERAFTEQLRISGSAEQAWQACQRGDGAASLSQEEALSFCKWLAASGLIRGAAAAQPAASDAAASAGPLRSAPSAALLRNLYFWKRPLFNPDRLLDQLIERAGALFAWQVLVAGLFVLLTAIVAMGGRWGEFFASYENLFSSWRWLWLAVAWVVLKLIHETAHAGTCKRYGGEVREAGVAVILLMPIAYVDVSSSWRFRSRWQRLHVTLAGVGAELCMAGLALWVWNGCDSLPLKQAAADLVLLASISSLLFNLNPLLKFDGYFALADTTGVDNLYSYGQSYARYWGARYVLGLNHPAPPMPTGHAYWIKIYGLAAAVYRVVTVAGLIIAAAAIFYGAGVVVAFAGVISFVLMPLHQLVLYLRGLHHEGNLYVGRLLIRLGGFTAIGLLLISITPIDLRLTAPAIVQYDPPAVVRAPVDGFVAQVHVVDGEVVTAGQPIVTLVNEALQQSLALLEKDLKQVEQEVRSARWNGDSSLLGKAQSRLAALREQIQEKQREVDSLTVRAPSNGRVVARQLATRLGCYLHQGDEIGAVGLEQRKRLKISLSQRDASRSQDWSHSPLRVVVAGRPSWTTHISHTESRASETIPDDSLIATNGGTLAVICGDADQVALCEPRVNAFVSLTTEQSRSLRCGQRAHVRLDCHYATLGSLIWNYFSG